MRPTDGGTESKEETTGVQAEVETELLEQSLGIAELAAERDAYLDQLQRVAAEYANYRRRTENEKIQDRKNATRELLGQLAPIADDFERALTSIPAAEAQGSWIEGVRLIERKLEGLLERADVHKIDALGAPFDPAVHEAVVQDPDNTESLVVEVYQNGYTLGNQLLRPAMVRVGNLPKAG
jgi:molecular chaperone GrpE